ncbi:MAG: ATP-binding protein [Actinomycetota bacterium]
MPVATHTDWTTANQRYLAARVQAVRRALERHAGLVVEEGPDVEEEAAWARAELPAPAAMDRLAAAFGLTAFEQDVMVLCAGVELDAGLGPVVAAAQGDARHGRPTFGLALAALPDAHWSALSPMGPLRRWRLIELGPGEVLTTAVLRIDERVLHHLAGVSQLDERLHGLAVPIQPPDLLSPSHAAVAARVAALWSQPHGDGHPAILLCGKDPAARRAIAAAAAAEADAGALAMHAADLPAPPADRDGLARIWEREAVLSGSVLVLEADEGTPEDRRRVLLSFLEAVHAPTVVSTADPIRSGVRPFVRIDVGTPTAEERAALWRALLGGHDDLQPEIDRVVGQFDLGVQGMRAATAEATSPVERSRPEGTLWSACRVQARPRLDDLAHRITPGARWDDLVLPESQRLTLREMAAHVRHRRTVYEEWGFAARSGRGLGVSALFSGSSGTGKTMAAEVLAAELDLDLYLIDLSSVVDKYIGETEKNLRRLFDAAEEGGAILLFDEADALFGRRSEVKDSHDRYANIEVSYLLQRMESYRGLAILTTNLKTAMDPAFLRRIRFIVNFPFPDPAAREAIWRRIFPEATPTEGLKPDLLARLNVSGGNIRNIAMNAAFLAAQEGVAVGMGHLLRAARGEYAKIDRQLTDAEVAGWT